MPRVVLSFQHIGQDQNLYSRNKYVVIWNFRTGTASGWDRPAWNRSQIVPFTLQDADFMTAIKYMMSFNTFAKIKAFTVVTNSQSLVQYFPIFSPA